MVTITRLLCPVDFSEFARRAVEHAVALARRHGARVTVLHVLPPVASTIPAGDGGLVPPVVYAPDDLEQMRQEIATFVGPSAGTEPVEVVVVQGSPVTEIVSLAAALPADMVVIGTHGRSGFQRLLLGSITERVLVRAPCPVLTVPNRLLAPAAADAPSFARILCAVDFSPASLQALAYARSLAEQPGATLTVATVVERGPVVEPVMMGGSGTPSYDPRAVATAEARLRDCLAKDARGRAPAAEVVSEGKAYAEILRLADERAADLIVLGAHGHGVLDRLFFGSTAQHVVRQTPCPVLTVRLRP